VTHGDRCVAFAEDLRADGFAASAPAVGESHEIGAGGP
jgi:putative mRNA 3-end processing factor